MRLGLLSALLASLALAAGCGGPGDSTPAACLEGPPAYLHALAAAPARVELAGTTPISECLAPNQTGGDLAGVGTALVSTATRLNAEARDEPGGEANLQLGYLVGAARRGAEGTEGIHAELIRRLVAAARYSPDGRSMPPAFLRAYRRGFDAGSERG